MGTTLAFSKCVLSEQSHTHVMCAECTFLPGIHPSIHPFPVFICVLCFTESHLSAVTSSVVTVNVFLRADEIEMVMTDLERANQVTRSTS